MLLQLGIGPYSTRKTIIVEEVSLDSFQSEVHPHKVEGIELAKKLQENQL